MNTKNVTAAPAGGGLADRPDPSMCPHKFMSDGRVCYLCGWDFRANGEPPAPASLSLAEVLAVLARVPCDWYVIEHPQWAGATTRIGRSPDEPYASFNQVAYMGKADAEATVGAVNYLRSRGEAWQEVAKTAGIVEVALRNIVTAGQAGAGYMQYADDLRAALAKVASNGSHE